MYKETLIKALKSHKFPDKIINAFKKVKREDFIPLSIRQYAYDDNALPLEKGATISQPYTIAFMLSLLELRDSQKILEIGSGSGYVLALINEISKKSKMYGIEIISSLAEKSKQIFKNNKNIIILNTNGSLGLPQKAPFDRILISAASEKIPEHLFNQLKDPGILVAPVQNSIWKIKKQNKKTTKKEFPGFVFVPLIKS